MEKTKEVDGVDLHSLREKKKKSFMVSNCIPMNSLIRVEKGKKNRIGILEAIHPPLATEEFSVIKKIRTVKPERDGAAEEVLLLEQIDTMTQGSRSKAIWGRVLASYKLLSVLLGLDGERLARSRIQTKTPKFNASTRPFFCFRRYNVGPLS